MFASSEPRFFTEAFPNRPGIIDERLIDHCKNDRTHTVAKFINKYYRDRKIPNHYKLLSLCCKYGRERTAGFLLCYYKKRPNIYESKYREYGSENSDYTLLKFIINEGHCYYDFHDYDWIMQRSCLSPGGFEIIKFIFEEYPNEINKYRNQTKDPLDFELYCAIAVLYNNFEAFGYFVDKLNVEEVSSVLFRISTYAKCERNGDRHITYFKFLVEEHKDVIPNLDFYIYFINSYKRKDYVLSNYILENLLNKEKHVFLHIIDGNLFLAELKESNKDKWFPRSTEIDNYIVYHENELKEEDRKEFLEAFGKHLSYFDKKLGRSAHV